LDVDEARVKFYLETFAKGFELELCSGSKDPEKVILKPWFIDIKLLFAALEVSEQKAVFGEECFLFTSSTWFVYIPCLWSWPLVSLQTL